MFDILTSYMAIAAVLHDSVTPLFSLAMYTHVHTQGIVEMTALWNLIQFTKKMMAWYYATNSVLPSMLHLMKSTTLVLILKITYSY